MIFTEGDIKTILRNTGLHRTAPPLLPSLPPTLELVSGGLVLEKHARSLIETIVLSDKTKRISLLNLASAVNLELRKAENLLPSEDKEWGRIGNLTIVGKGEFVTLKEDLQAKLNGNVLSAAKYCQEKSIDLHLFRKILRSFITESSDIQWLGDDRDMICTTLLWEDSKAHLLPELMKARRPVDIHTIFPHREFPIDFFTRLVVSTLREQNEFLGKLKGTTYIPQVYEKERMNNLIERLKRDSVLELELLRQEGIKNPEQFVKEQLSSVYFLDKHVITDKYLEQLDRLIGVKLETDGWADVKDSEIQLSPGDEKILRHLIKSQRGPDIEEHAAQLVTRALKESLIERAVTFAGQQAETATITKATTVKWQELLMHLSGTTTAPVPVLTSLLNTIHPIAVAKFTEQSIKLKETAISSAKEIFLGKCIARFRIHYQALQAITDESLCSKLGADFTNYSRDLIIGQLDKLETVIKSKDLNLTTASIHDLRQAIQLQNKSNVKPDIALNELNQHLASFMNEMAIPPVSDEQLKSKKREILNDMSAQLQKTKDGSLALTIVLIVIHAQLSEGVLRASGKYVPKLLKLLQNRIDGTLFDDLVKMKDAVITRSNFTDRDFARLRQIVQQSGSI